MVARIHSSAKINLINNNELNEISKYFLTHTQRTDTEQLPHSYLFWKNRKLDHLPPFLSFSLVNDLILPL